MIEYNGMEPIHLIKNKVDQDVNLLLNLIPIIVFVVSLAVVLLVMHSNKKLSQANSNYTVLGGQAESNSK